MFFVNISLFNYIYCIETESNKNEYSKTIKRLKIKLKRYLFGLKLFFSY
jgi:hypothetical protein